MRKYQLDYDKSKEVYENFKDCIKVKECYNNVFNVFDLNNGIFRSGRWKIAYGFAEIMPCVYCRHGFIIDENDKVIDPTLFVQTNEKSREYYVMYAFDDVDEYLNAIESDNLMPALNTYLRDKERQAYKWAENNGIIFCG